MGLKKSIVARSGSTHANAYLNFSSRFTCDWKEKKASFGLDIYENQAACTDGKSRLLSVVDVKTRFKIEGDAFDTYLAIDVLDALNTNPVKQCYLYAKTILEDTTDVLE